MQLKLSQASTPGTWAYEEYRGLKVTAWTGLRVTPLVMVNCSHECWTVDNEVRLFYVKTGSFKGRAVTLFLPYCSFTIFNPFANW